MKDLIAIFFLLVLFSCQEQAVKKPTLDKQSLQNVLESSEFFSKAAQDFGFSQNGLQATFNNLSKAEKVEVANFATAYTSFDDFISKANSDQKNVFSKLTQTNPNVDNFVNLVRYLDSRYDYAKADFIALFSEEISTQRSINAKTENAVPGCIQACQNQQIYATFDYYCAYTAAGIAPTRAAQLAVDAGNFWVAGCYAGCSF